LRTTNGQLFLKTRADPDDYLMLRFNAQTGGFYWETSKKGQLRFLTELE